MSWKEWLREALHSPRSPRFQRVQRLVWFLIFASLLLVSLELFLPELGSAPWFILADQLILLLLGLELFLRVWLYTPPDLALFDLTPQQRLRLHLRGRLSYCLRPFNLIDLITVLALVPALRGLRAFRLLRLLKTKQFFRYSSPVQGLVRAFSENSLLYSAAFSLLGLTVALGGISFYLVEGGVNSDVNSPGDGMWWALVTLSTVGFGDITPVTSMGRMVSGGMMISGMFLLALFAGIIGQTILSTILSIREEQYHMMNRSHHLVIFGFHPGAHLLLDVLLENVSSEDLEILLFAPGERPKELPPRFGWVSGDPTKESELDKVSLPRASAVLVVGDRSLAPQQADATTILTVFTLRSFLMRQDIYQQRKSPLKILAEILDTENVAHARIAGADEVIETTRLGFTLMARSLDVPGASSVIQEVVADEGVTLHIREIPPSIELPLSFSALRPVVREQLDANLIGVQLPAAEGQRGAIQLNPAEDSLVEPGMALIYLARSQEQEEES